MKLTQILTRQVERMWWQRNTPSAWLAPAASLYAYLSRREQRQRQRNAESPRLPLISVGNITAGGSGKTPFVIWLADELRAAGHRPVVLCRGDGGKQQAPKLLSDHEDPADVGDEALLLQRECGCPVIAGRDRIAGSRMAAKLGDILLLDDGFQYRQLQRSCDIVLVPAAGVGNGGLIPAGPLREPLDALARADLIVRTGEGSAAPLGKASEWRWRTGNTPLYDRQGLGQATPERVTALTGIARPQRFLDSLKHLGIAIGERHLFPDHHPFDQDDIIRALHTGLPVATTAKDAVKLERLWPDDTPLWVLEQQPDPEAGLFDAIRTFVG